jgi:hypothetical protein
MESIRARIFSPLTVITNQSRQIALEKEVTEWVSRAFVTFGLLIDRKKVR